MARATASASITWGLVTIPVKVYVAQSPNKVSFNQITPKGNRVSQKVFDCVTGEEVSRGDLKKGYEYAKGQYVIFEPDELKQLESTDTSKTVDIKEFVPAETVDGLFVEKSYYLSPDKGGDKGYALLAKAMIAKGVVAVGQWTSRGKEHLVVIRPKAVNGMYVLVFQQMYYAGEVREATDYGVSGSEANEAEFQMAGQLIDMLSTFGFEPESYKDSYFERVQTACEQKVAGADVCIPAPKESGPNVVDLMAALKQSLDSKAS